MKLEEKERKPKMCSFFSRPGISIVMPFYNGELYIKDTLECLRKQSFEDFELICVDDCSSDNSYRIIEEFQITDKRIRLLRNESRQGAARSRNIGLKLCRGEYLSFLDADDLFSERMLEKSYRLAVENELDVLEFGYRRIDENGLFLDEIQRVSDVEKGKIVSSKYLSLYQFYSISTNAWSKLFRRSFIVDQELEFQDLDSSNDVFFSLSSICFSNRVMFINDTDIEARYRVHKSNNRITNNRNPLNDYRAYRRILERLLKEEKQNEIELVYGVLYARLVGVMKENTSFAEIIGQFMRDSGIRELQDMLEERFDYLESLYGGLFERFSQNLENGWYRNEGIVSVILRNSDHDFWTQWSDDQRVAIIGTGSYSRQVLQIANEKKKEFIYVYDDNEKNIGKEYWGTSIRELDSIVNDDVDMVIVTLKEYNKIKKILDGIENLRVIYLSEYLNNERNY